MATLNLLEDYTFNDLTGVKNAPIIPATTQGPQSYTNGTENYVPQPPFENTNPVQPGTPTGTPAAPSPYTGTSAPTIADTLANIKNQALGLQTDINNGNVTGLTTPYVAPTPETQEPWKSTNLSEQEEKRIRRQQLKMFQKEIDATNQIYDQMMREEQTRGQGRVGSTTAMGARAGILGSDFANTQQETIKDYNKQIQKGISAERSAKIAGIMGEARKSAADEIAKKNAARKQDADSYIEYLKGAKERKTENLGKLAGSLINQGVDPSTMDKEELSKIATSYGTTVEDIIYSYQTAKSEADAAAAKTDLETRKTESEIAKNGRIELSEGGAIYDASGNLIAKNNKTYAPSSRETLPGDEALNDPTVKAWVGQIGAGKAKISNVPKEYKNAVIRAMEMSTGTTLNEDVATATEIRRLAQELLDDKEGLSDAVGPISSKLWSLEGSTTDYENKVDRLKALISKSNLATMRGLGSMSNIEFQNMQAIGTALGLNMSDDGMFHGAFRKERGGFAKELQRIIDTTGTAIEAVPTTSAEAQTGTLADGTVVTKNGDGTITDAQGNEYDENGNRI